MAGNVSHRKKERKRRMMGMAGNDPQKEREEG
jgi:hypothetical protein